MRNIRLISLAITFSAGTAAIAAPVSTTAQATTAQASAAASPSASTPSATLPEPPRPPRSIQEILSGPRPKMMSFDSNKNVKFLPFKVTAKSPLADRYIAAGDQAHMKGDDETAKKYWLAALSEYERHIGASGTIGRFPSLEHRLLDMYPKDWSRSPLKGAALLQAQEEQVAIYERINRLMQPYMTYGRTSLIGQYAQSRLQSATKDLKATKDKLASTGAQPTK